MKNKIEITIYFIIIILLIVITGITIQYNLKQKKLSDIVITKQKELIKLIKEDKSLSTQPESDKLQNEIKLLDEKIAKVKSEIDLVSPDKISYLRYNEILEKIILKYDPKVALQKLSKDITTYKVVQEKCHSFTHEIGHNALVKYENDYDKALSFQLDTCGSGYIHGMVEELFEKTTDPVADTKRICASGNGSCIHGAGHGMMYNTNYDVNKSVSLCKQLPIEWQTYCAEGAFMENYDFRDGDLSVRPNLDESNPFALCQEQTGVYKDACYYYVGRWTNKLANGNYYKSLEYCTTVPDYSYNHSCARGLGAAIIRQFLTSPEKVEEHCFHFPELSGDCMVGVMNYYTLMFNIDRNTGKQQICDKFTNIDKRKQCMAV